MILAARIDIIESAIELIDGSARDLRRAHTLPPHAVWPPEDSVAQADHDRMLLIAHQLRTMVVEMRTEIDLMERISGVSFQPLRR